MRRHRPVFLLAMTCAVALLGEVCVRGSAQPAGAPLAPAPAPSHHPITRLDVARAYEELDRALRERPPKQEAERARIHKEFDDATVMYFRREFPQALRVMHDLAASLDPAAPGTPAFESMRLLRGLRVRVSPYVAVEKRPTPLRIRVTTLYPLNLTESVKVRVVIRPDDTDGAAAATKPAKAKSVLDREVEVAPSGMTPVITAMQPDAPQGKYRIDLVAPDGTTRRAGEWYVAEQSFDRLRQLNERQLGHIRPGQGAEQMIQAVSAVLARNNLLSDQLSENESARFSSDPVKLAAEVKREMDEVMHDRDPFVDRRGDYWRTALLGAQQVPMRVYAPEQAVSGQPVPVVIALHGAGVEEAIFMEGYGDGEIKRLADRHGFLVIAPSTYLMTAPDALASLLDTIAFDYLIDRRRVYVVGHSLGAMTAQAWATQQGDDLAAVCLLAGGTDFPAGRPNLPPVLMVAAGLDPLYKPDALRRAADGARQAGLPVKFRLSDGLGHTLMVGDALPAAVEWLLQHRRK